MTNNVCRTIVYGMQPPFGWAARDQVLLPGQPLEQGGREPAAEFVRTQEGEPGLKIIFNLGTD